MIKTDAVAEATEIRYDEGIPTLNTSLRELEHKIMEKIK